MIHDLVSIDIFKVLGGFGIFLVSLRTLTQVLQRSLSRRVRGALSHSLSTRWRCLWMGLLATIVVQASSITVMTSMGLVGSTLINLEQGFFLVLGATLGTTVKVWFVGAEILKTGPLLVGFGSISLLFAKRNNLREILEATVAIGFTLWGMLLLKEGLELVHNRVEVLTWLRAHPGDNLYNQFLGVLLGTALAAILQSSSTVVFLAVALASAGFLAFPQAAALVLGANVGTTFVPFIASLEHGRTMRQLAVAYTSIKVIGAAITLFFFPQFLNFAVMALPVDWPVALQIAAVHTLFNLVNVMFWSLFCGPTLRLVEKAVPDTDFLGGPGLAPVVRKILSRSPARSLQESQRQMAHLTQAVKSLLDRCGGLLQGDTQQMGLFETRLLEQREFENLKDSTYELLIQAGHNSRGDAADGAEIRRRLYELSFYEELFYEAWRLREQLEFGLLREGLELPDELRVWMGRFQRTVDEYWLSLIFPGQAVSPGPASQGFLLTLENHYFAHLTSASGGAKNWGLTDWESSVWAFDVLNGIRELIHRLGRAPRPPADAISSPSAE